MKTQIIEKIHNPEFLENAGLYFEPTNIEELEKVLIKLIFNPDLRSQLAKKSLEYSNKYSWEICANSTYQFLSTFCIK